MVPKLARSIVLLACILGLTGCSATCSGSGASTYVPYEGPDMVVSSSDITVLPATVTYGEKVVIRTRIRSAGTTATSAAKGGLYINGRLMQPMVDIGPMQPGEYREYEVQWVANRLGRCRVEFRADLYNQSGDGRGSNNRASKTITVAAAAPLDLVDPSRTYTPSGASAEASASSTNTNTNTNTNTSSSSSSSSSTSSNATQVVIVNEVHYHTDGSSSERQGNGSWHRRGDQGTSETGDGSAASGNSGNSNTGDDGNNANAEPNYDLAVVSGSLAVGVGNGGKTRISVTVENVGGTVQGHPGYVQFTLDGMLIGPRCPVNQLAPDESAAVSVDVRPEAGGEHLVGATLLYTAGRVDLDAGNNSTSATLVFPEQGE